jgi:hypothetical protein
VNLNDDDAQTLWDVTYFARELLKHADVLPADLAGMLHDYQSELRTSPPGRWAGIGDPVQYECLARRMAESVTDGEWAEGERLDDPARNRHARAEAPGNFQRALVLLAARGDIVTRDGRYYTRSRDDRS